MSNFYVGEVLFETGGTIDTPGDINVTSICDCTGSVGTAGQLLSSTGASLQWTTAGSAGIPCSIITGKGVLVTGTAANTPAALPVGTFGQVLLADSGCATGLKWGSVPTASVTGLGAMYGCVTSSAPNNTSVGYFTLPYGSTTCTIAIGNNSMIGAQGDSHIAIGVSIGSTGSGTACNIAIGNGIGGGNFQASLENVIIGQYAGCVCVSTSSKNVIIGAKAAQTLSTACNNVAIGYGVTPPAPTSDCTLAIGYDTGCHWLTGDSTKAIKPGAGIIDCANSCGTAGQVLASNGSNAVCWISIVNPTNATPTVEGIVLGCTTADRVSLGCSALTSLTTGLRNVAVGVNGLGLATSGCDNIAIGDDAACSLTDGLCNIAIGTLAMGNVVSVCSNTAIGYSTLRSSSGAGNVGVGNLVLCATTTGASNTAVGFYSLRNNSTGFNNTAVGLGTLCSATTAAGNVAVGTGALGLTTTSGCNTAIGTSVLRSSTGTFNTGLGNNALYANTTASNNVALGGNALICNTTGGTNTAVGVNALFANTTGACNTAIGTNSLCLSNGSFNVALGHLAGCSITTGSNNLVLGFNVQVPVVTGSCQLAIGFSTTDNWLTGTSTKAIKPGAGIIDCANSCGTAGQVLMSNGANAICWGTVGGGGGSSATPTAAGIVFGCTSADSTALGCETLLGLTSGTLNTAIGRGALSALTTGSRNVALGSGAGQSITTGCSNLILGYSTNVPNAAGDCQLAIGVSGSCWLSGDSNFAVKPGAGLIDSTNSCGTAGQVLTSTGSNSLQWATPQTSPFITYTTAPTSYTSGTPLLVGIWGGGTMEATISLDLVGYGGVQIFWNVWLSGDATNYNTGWNNINYWPTDPASGVYQGSWYVDFPVYPDPNANKWMLYFSPSTNSLNPSTFTFFYRLLGGGGAPAWQI